MSRPLRILVFSSLWPCAAAPAAGAFIRARMSRVAQRVPVAVVSPQPWSPLDGLIRRFVRPAFRPLGPRFERMDGIEVHRPRYLSLPGLGKRFDGLMMALGARRAARRVAARLEATLVDAHFLYPTGYAAARVADALRLPLTVTIRGSADEWLLGTAREPAMRTAVRRAARVICVSDALRRDVALPLGADPARCVVVGNGVDLDNFERLDRRAARRALGLPEDAPVLIGVGSLIDRKGFHRVIPLLPALRERHPGLTYLIVGGGATHGDMREALERLARRHGVADAVRFCGPQLPERLKHFYSAADVFTLATSHEGWANVFLEAMACGLPVVTTRVGGNVEVVCDPALGILVDWWDEAAFGRALDEALGRAWDRNAIVAHARANAWDFRIDRLMVELEAAATEGTSAASANASLASARGVQEPVA